MTTAERVVGAITNLMVNGGVTKCPLMEKHYDGCSHACNYCHGTNSVQNCNTCSGAGLFRGRICNDCKGRGLVSASPERI